MNAIASELLASDHGLIGAHIRSEDVRLLAWSVTTSKQQYPEGHRGSSRCSGYQEISGLLVFRRLLVAERSLALME